MATAMAASAAATNREECFRAPPTWQRVVEVISSVLEPRGIDLVSPLSLDWYNADVDVRLRCHPSFGGGGDPIPISIPTNGDRESNGISTLSPPSGDNDPDPDRDQDSGGSRYDANANPVAARSRPSVGRRPAHDDALSGSTAKWPCGNGARDAVGLTAGCGRTLLQSSSSNGSQTRGGATKPATETLLPPSSSSSSSSSSLSSSASALSSACCSSLSTELGTISTFCRFCGRSPLARPSSSQRPPPSPSSSSLRPSPADEKDLKANGNGVTVERGIEEDPPPPSPLEAIAALAIDPASSDSAMAAMTAPGSSSSSILTAGSSTSATNGSTSVLPTICGNGRAASDGAGDGGQEDGMPLGNDDDVEQAAGASDGGQDLAGEEYEVGREKRKWNVKENEAKGGYGGYLAILIGNSRAMWSKFIESISQKGSHYLDDCAHPLNEYVEESIVEAIDAADTYMRSCTWPDRLTVSGTMGLCVCGRDRLTEELAIQRSEKRSGKCEIFWGHDTRPGRLIAIQRMAHIAGVAFLDQVSHLCLHPQFGPWFSLRAVLVFDLEPPTIRPRELKNPLTPAVIHKVQDALNVALKLAAGATHDDCGGGQRKATSRKVHGTGKWRRWVEVRDQIHPDHPMRYSEDQIDYHYTSNRDLLKQLTTTAHMLLRQTDCRMLLAQRKIVMGGGGRISKLERTFVFEML
ncbi:hypothetical protein CBR_g12747 [Chara braunii]|uniref:Cyanocobalamin reductase (cyanide-eliminating) n=1 Tax=Chara braunii TaxID=69332 RepID=A0A388KSQ2_CHABU|nr:hypothetical protein CBR_g12747 [Chara braunii]|eukprot:GBG73028.1 hypothetical protein CBR_g12747 [Chara braunii]